MVHVVRGAQGPRQLRGLMIDITERKRAEQALRRSERKYSEAFRREREAAQRLRALDEMKNTFLEAVSHDLRTPLTSILGSALTLEQTELNLPKEDALDLVGRIAANARKLERLLSDLLDLDRLQRGIVSPQRRPTDLADLVHRSVDGTENPARRDIQVEVESITVSVDAAKVERILENLLSNAIRHTPDGTRIWIRGFGQDGGVMLIVEDEGTASLTSCTKPCSSRSGRRRARRRGTPRASASGSRSCDASRSSTAAGRGWRIVRAAALRSTCSSPEADVPVRVVRRYGDARGVRVRP